MAVLTVDIGGGLAMDVPGDWTTSPIDGGVVAYAVRDTDREAAFAPNVVALTMPEGVPVDFDGALALLPEPLVLSRSADSMLFAYALPTGNVTVEQRAVTSHVGTADQVVLVTATVATGALVSDWQTVEDILESIRSAA